MLATILNEYWKLAIAQALLLCTLPHKIYRSTLVKGGEKNSKYMYAGKVIRSNFSSKKRFLLSKKQLCILQNHFLERNHTSFDLAIHVFVSVDAGTCGWMYWLSCANQSPLR